MFTHNIALILHVLFLFLLFFRFDFIDRRGLDERNFALVFDGHVFRQNFRHLDTGFRLMDLQYRADHACHGAHRRVQHVDVIRRGVHFLRLTVSVK